MRGYDEGEDTILVAMTMMLFATACRVGYSPAAGGPEEAAKASAESWLALVDQQKYSESWDQAAKLFKGAVTKEQWQTGRPGPEDPWGS